jgi:acetyltransferase-like isoleucine patch superfamily enzyme
MIASAINLTERLCMGLASRGRNVWLKRRGVRIGAYCWLRQVEIPRSHHNVKLDGCSLDRGVVLLCSGPESPDVKLSIGPGTYINRRTFLDAVDSLFIGQNVAIGPNCYITDHDHGTDLSKLTLHQAMVSAATRIGDGVWIGASVTVLKGVTIGDRTIIGAGSVVTKSLPADVIAAGVPARVIRLRTEADVAAPSKENL